MHSEGFSSSNFSNVKAQIFHMVCNQKKKLTCEQDCMIMLNPFLAACLISQKP